MEVPGNEPGLTDPFRVRLPGATRNLQIMRSRLDPSAGLVGLSALLSEEICSVERLDRLLPG